MKKALLLILDGFGEGSDDLKKNAIKKAKMPFYQKLRNTYPMSLLGAKGRYVGLPDGYMGGSEVGHLTIGAGRIVVQPLEEIFESFRQNTFAQNPDFHKWVQLAKQGSPIHLLGMISDAGVHSDIRHLYHLLEVLKAEGVMENVFLHAIADGRDVEPKSVARYIQEITKHTAEIGVGKLVSLCGRYYAMDRDKNWERTQVSYDLLTQKRGKKLDIHKDFEEILSADAENDYYLPAYLIDDFPKVDVESLFLFWNFRSDRAEQLSRVFLDSKFSEFPVNFQIPKTHFLAFGPFTLNRAPVLFTPKEVKNSLGEVISQQGLRQLRVAETEKFAHVTFFFNAQQKELFPAEDRVMVPSPKCASYADAPEMSAREITDVVCKSLEHQSYDLIVCNFANADLVGHSGNFMAAITAAECLDECLEQIIPLAQKQGYEILLTADHGNSDDMTYEDGSPKPAHSMNPVPCLVISSQKNIVLAPQGGLENVAPTLLELMGIEKPKEMDGESLITGSE